MSFNEADTRAKLIDSDIPIWMDQDLIGREDTIRNSNIVNCLVLTCPFLEEIADGKSK